MNLFSLGPNDTDRFDLSGLDGFYFERCLHLDLSFFHLDSRYDQLVLKRTHFLSLVQFELNQDLVLRVVQPQFSVFLLFDLVLEVNVVCGRVRECCSQILGDDDSHDDNRFNVDTEPIKVFIHVVEHLHCQFRLDVPGLVDFDGPDEVPDVLLAFLLEHFLEPIGAQIVKEVFAVFLEGGLLADVEVDAHLHGHEHVVGGGALLDGCVEPDRVGRDHGGDALLIRVTAMAAGGEHACEMAVMLLQRDDPVRHVELAVATAGLVDQHDDGHADVVFCGDHAGPFLRVTRDQLDQVRLVGDVALQFVQQLVHHLLACLEVVLLLDVLLLDLLALLEHHRLVVLVRVVVRLLTELLILLVRVLVEGHWILL